MFQADRSVYQRGGTARITLRNATDQAIGYNLCHTARELRARSVWQRYEHLRLCTAELRVLAPGNEIVLREPITDEWQAGDYRMVTTVHARCVGVEVFTPPFSVHP